MCLVLYCVSYYIYVRCAVARCCTQWTNHCGIENKTNSLWSLYHGPSIMAPVNSRQWRANCICKVCRGTCHLLKLFSIFQLVECLADTSVLEVPWDMSIRHCLGMCACRWISLRSLYSHQIISNCTKGICRVEVAQIELYRTLIAYSLLFIVSVTNGQSIFITWKFAWAPCVCALLEIEHIIKWITYYAPHTHTHDPAHSSMKSKIHLWIDRQQERCLNDFPLSFVLFIFPSTQFLAICCRLSYVSIAIGIWDDYVSVSVCVWHKIEES